jgi:hypothetical protein
VPSTPGYPQGRETASRVPSRREYESYDWYESATLVLAANALFQEVVTFSGKAERVTVQISAVPVNLRFRYRGEAGGTPIRLGAIGSHDFRVTTEIVEVQDAAGAGGQTITVTGHHPARGIDIRQNRPGPLREPQTLADTGRARQIEQR